MHREREKKAKKLRVTRDEKTQWGTLEGLGRTSGKELLADGRHWKNRVVEVVGSNSALWEMVSWSSSFLKPIHRFLVFSYYAFLFFIPVVQACSFLWILLLQASEMPIHDTSFLWTQGCTVIFLYFKKSWVLLSLGYMILSSTLILKEL